MSIKALDTATKIVVDIAETLIAASPVNTATELIDTMPPIYPYIARVALRHIDSSTQRDDTGLWLGSARDVLQTSVDRYFERWNVSDDESRFKTAAKGGSVSSAIQI